MENIKSIQVELTEMFRIDFCVNGTVIADSLARVDSLDFRHDTGFNSIRLNVYKGGAYHAVDMARENIELHKKIQQLTFQLEGKNNSDE